MYTDSQLARDVESRDDLAQDRHDQEGARQDWHAARVAEVLKRLEPRMVLHPTPEELGQAMAAVMVSDLVDLAFFWGQKPAYVSQSQAMFYEFRRLISIELRKMADTAAEEQVQREEREQEGEAKRVRRVVLGDEL